MSSSTPPTPRRASRAALRAASSLMRLSCSSLLRGGALRCSPLITILSLLHLWQHPSQQRRALLQPTPQQLREQPLRCNSHGSRLLSGGVPCCSLPLSSPVAASLSDAAHSAAACSAAAHSAEAFFHQPREQSLSPQQLSSATAFFNGSTLRCILLLNTSRATSFSAAVFGSSLLSCGVLCCSLLLRSLASSHPL